MPNSLSSLFLQGKRPLLWLILIVAILYGPTVLFDFAFYDDNVLIKDNQAFLSNPANVGKAFLQHNFAAHTPFGRYYRPLVTLTYMLDTWIGGGEPWAYHLSNTLIFALAVCLLYALLLELPAVRPVHAFFASLLFAVHPMQVMAVAWIPGRNDTLLAAAFFACLLAFIRHRKTGKIAFLLLHLFLFFVALLIKEIAVVIPVMALGWLWFVEEDRDWKKWPDKTPFYVWMGLGIVWFLMRGRALGVFMAGDPGNYPMPLVTKVLTMAGLILRYYGKALFPLNLALLPDSYAAPLRYGLILAAVTGLLYFLVDRKTRALMLYGLLGAMLILALSIPFSEPEEVRNLGLLEHRMVAAWGGVLIAWTAVAASFRWRFPRMGGGVLATLLFIFLFMTTQRLPNLTNCIHFWTTAVKESPNASHAWHNYGSTLLYYYRYEEAEKATKQALKLDPNRTLSHLNLSYIYFRKKRYNEAIEQCFLELSKDPSSAKACEALSYLYRKTGAPELSRDWTERARQLKAGLPPRP